MCPRGGLRLSWALAKPNGKASPSCGNTGGHTPGNTLISYEAIYQAVKAGAEAAQLEIDIDGRELTRTLKGLGVAMA